MKWQRVKFKDFIQLQRGFDLPKSIMQEGEVPVLGSNCIIGYHNEAKVEPPGVVTGRSGTLGFVQYIDSPYWPHNTALWVKDFKKNHPKFVFYKLQTLNLETFNAGVSVPTLNRNVLDDLEVSIPNYEAQRQISEILSAYDDLIENNRRRMALLEEAARQLYREWFVRLRFPGYEHTRITNGVPGGWRYEKVGNILAKIESTKRIPKDAYLNEGPIPCVDQSAEFIGGFTEDEDALYSQPLPVTIFGDHTRALKFVNFAFARGADGTQIIYPNTTRISSEYLYLALREVDLSNYFYARHFKFLKEKEVLLPETSLVREFTSFVRTWFEQIQTLRHQTQKLRAARDLLLPRLISGEIQV